MKWSKSPNIPKFFSSKLGASNNGTSSYQGFRPQGKGSEEERRNVPVSGSRFKAACWEEPQGWWVQVPAVVSSGSPVPHLPASSRASLSCPLALLVLEAVSWAVALGGSRVSIDRWKGRDRDVPFSEVQGLIVFHSVWLGAGFQGTFQKGFWKRH